MRDRSTLFPLLKRCTTLRHIQSIHSALATSGLLTSLPPSSTYPRLLLALTSLPTPSPSPSYASSLFLSIPSPSTFPFNLLIRAHLLSSSPLPALLAFLRMRRSSVTPDSHTFPFALKASASLPFPPPLLARALHAQALSFGHHSDLFVRNSLLTSYASSGLLHDARKVFDEGPATDVVSYNALIHGYVKSGQLRAAREVFDEMPERNAASFGTLMAGCSHRGRPEDVFDMFDRMVATGLRPDDVGLVALLSACARSGQLNRGRSVHEYIESARIEMNERLVTGLIHMYARCGCVAIAIEVFESSRCRNLFAWNAIIAGVALHGHGALSLEYFFRMRETGVRADGVTFLGVLMGCSHAGLVGMARRLFAEMEGVYGVERELKHYGCMADMLGRAGLIREAVEMVRGMPMAGDVYVWGSLLGGCRIHGNVRVAEIAVRRLLELNPGDSGVYSAMANIYVDARRWEDAARIRRFISHNSAVTKKGRGCSSLC